MKYIYMGTGAFAVAPLEALLKSSHKALCVVTQTDKPSSRRGKKVVYSPVKQCALEHGLKVYQPEDVSSEESFELLSSLGADVVIVCSYGQLLKKNILEMCPQGALNIHGSLLPAYRGAAPITRCIMDDELFTGISVMYMDEGLDTGDVMMTEKCPVKEEDTFTTLSDTLSALGGQLIEKALDALKRGYKPRTPQNEQDSSYAQKITKEDKIIDFSRNGRSVFNRIRALDRYPAAQTTLYGKTLKLFDAQYIAASHAQRPGTIVSAGKKGVMIACGDDYVLIKTVKPEGKNETDAYAFYNGVQNKKDIVFK